jgi:DNA-binding transcriptional ArsR family regulator
VEAAVKAIAAPRRRQILTLVRDGELSAGEIAGHFEITRPAVSQHLNVLKEAGLVSERRNGRGGSTGPPGRAAELKEFLEEFWERAPQRTQARGRTRGEEKRCLTQLRVITPAASGSGAARARLRRDRHR